MNSAWIAARGSSSSRLRIATRSVAPPPDSMRTDTATGAATAPRRMRIASASVRTAEMLVELVWSSRNAEPCSSVWCSASRRIVMAVQRKIGSMWIAP